MAFVYDIACATTPLTGGGAGSEVVQMAIRQGNLSAGKRGVDIQAFSVIGRGAGLTAISGISLRVKRWTTGGTGGTACTVNPRRLGTTADTAAVDSGTTITPGTVSGAIQLLFGCGAAGPSGWAAMNPDSMIHMEGGSQDECDVYSTCGTASIGLDLGVEIAE